jgi:hypothetical protein
MEKTNRENLCPIGACTDGGCKSCLDSLSEEDGEEGEVAGGKPLQEHLGGRCG